MEHLICSVGPRRYIICNEAGDVVQDRQVELTQFRDADGQTKYINPVHSLAWSNMMDLYRKERHVR